MDGFERQVGLKNMDRGQSFNFNSHFEADKILSKHKLTSEEYDKILKILNRTPTMAELGVFSAMWSEHCSYKSSKVHLKRLPSKGKNVVVGPGENAGVIKLHNDLCVAFKMESHNHPSFIDPYQGAATGVGGILRDIFCMGARPVANINALRFGEKKHPKTNWLMNGTVKGIGDYGNCVGIPTVGGNISFDKSYNGNILVNAMSVGLIHRKKIFKGNASGIGNLIIYLGSPTGRDGIHGATMASDSFDSKKNTERSAVQVGDPFWEKILMEATLESLNLNLIEGIQDMGAAGLTSSIFEMADRAQNGLYIDLNKIPTRANNMTPYELLLSETQERMIMVIKEENWPKLEKVLVKWDIAHAIIGCVTNSGKVEATFDNRLELEVPVTPLVANAPCYDLPIKRLDKNPDTQSTLQTFKIKESHIKSIIKLTFEKLNLVKQLTEQYDQHIGSKSILNSFHQGAAIISIDSSHSDCPVHEIPNNIGISISSCCLESFCEVDAYLGAAHSVGKAARAIFASGGIPLGITDCLNFGNPNDPIVMGTFSDAIDGISEACNELEIPVISGNVSFYNETDGVSIAPTPMIGMVGKVENTNKSTPALANRPGAIYMISPVKPSYSFLSPDILKIMNIPNTHKLPELDWETENESASIISKIIIKNNIIAARDIGNGGIFTTCLKIANLDKFGVEFDIPLNSNQIADTCSSYIFISNDSVSSLNDGLDFKKCYIKKIGNMRNNREVKVNGHSFSLNH